jgi:hypothetical protein
MRIARRTSQYFLALALLGGCASVTDASPTSVSLRGAWHYTAAQTTGTRVTYDGTLTITQQDGRVFSGGLDAQAVTAQGNVVRVNGVASGRIVSDGTVDFDLQFPDDTRRHVGNIVADTIRGSWASGDLTLLGSWQAVRIR